MSETVTQDVVQPNDNRSAGGRQGAGRLTLNLVARTARWFPEGPNGPAITVPTFAEQDKAPQIPGPLLRVARNTRIVVNIRNDLDSTIFVYGLRTRPAQQHDSVAIPHGRTHTFDFNAGAPGTYLYHARIAGIDYVKIERETLSGAFVVDSSTKRPDDRVFVMNIWGDFKDSTTYRNALAINGVSWPHTEHISAKVGDTLHWRVVNASNRAHPMHLHGFYYTMTSRGDGLTDTTYTAEQRSLSVTERMTEYATMSLDWTPDRPGNWLFHCHIGFHVVPVAATLDPPIGHQHGLSADAGQHMSGLVLGIDVQGAPGKASAPPPQQMHMFVQEGKRNGRAARGLGFVLQRDERLPASDSVELPGSLIVLERGQPVDITVVNRLKENTGVHWHGIELESPSDGVPGWSGFASNLAPAIAPGDSFVAHLTLPRAGTFIYHTHLNDLEQMTSGLYGPLLVTERGQPFDPRTDHVFVVGWNGAQEPPHIIVNGDSVMAPPLQLEAGKPHRFRFINIGLANSAFIELRRDSVLQNWRALAKDGADLPKQLQTERPSKAVVTVGETADFSFSPRPGKYSLALSHPELGTYYTRAIVVR